MTANKEEIKALAELILSAAGREPVDSKELAALILSSGLVLPSPSVVSPLVWELLSNKKTWVSNTKVRSYEINTVDSQYMVFESRNYVHPVHIGTFDTVEEAKAFAHTHHSTLIGSCLQRPKPLAFTDIKPGMIVVDNDGDAGAVKECADPHNVLVEYEGGGNGIHCMVEGCDEFDKSRLYKYSCLVGGGYTEEQMKDLIQYMYKRITKTTLAPFNIEDYFNDYLSSLKQQ